MPNIREYNNEAPVFQPSNAAAGALSAAAGAITGAGARASRAIDYLGQDVKSAFNAVGKTAATAYDQFIVQPEISKGGALFAVTKDTLGREWNDLANSSDVNDASIRGKFLEGMDAKLDKVVQGFETTDGRLWAERHATGLKEHLQETTASDMAARASQALKANQTTIMNAATNDVYNNPSSANFDYNMKFYADQVKMLAQNSSHLSPAAKAHAEGSMTQEGQKNIAQSAARGLAHLDPDAAIKDLGSGKYDKYISGEEKDMLIRYAQVQKRAMQADDDRARLEEKRQKVETSEARKGDYLKLLYNNDPKVRNSVTYDKVVNDLKLDENGREHMLLAMDTRDKRLTGQKNTDDPEAVADLSRRLFDPNNPTTLDQLIKAEWDGGVSERTGNRIRQNIMDLKREPATPQFKAAIDAVEARMTYAHPMVGKDPNGKTTFSQFVNDFYPKYQAMVREGTVPPNALDINDPTSLISQSMKSYIRPAWKAFVDKTEEQKKFGAELGSFFTKQKEEAEAKQKAAARSAPTAPAPIRHIQGLQRNKTTGNWYDPATKNLYNEMGKEIPNPLRKVGGGGAN